MRIISGHRKGKILQSPQGMETRPTGDKMRAALFNILQHAAWADCLHPHFENAVILDLFAGSGALSLEALSRGAQFSTLVEQDSYAIKTCKINVTQCQMLDQCRIMQRDALKLPQRPTNIRKANLVFLDPPYGHNLGITALQNAIAQDWLAGHAVILLEMDKKRPETLDGIPNATKIDSRDYGASRLDFYLFQI